MARTPGVAAHRIVSYAKMGGMVDKRKIPRGGVLRTRTTVRLHPDHEKAFRGLAEKMGLTLSDTLAYFCAVGANLEVPDDIKAELAAGPRQLPNQRSRHKDPGSHQDLLIA